MKRRPILEITVLYALFGGFWIVVSDRIVEALFSGETTLLVAQTVKGLLYVSVTAALVYWLASRAWRRTERELAEIKRAETRVRRSEALYRALVGASPLAVFCLDPDGTVRIWNDAAEQMFGWLAREVEGKPLPIVPEDKEHEFAALRERVLAGEAVVEEELRRRRKDGSEIFVSLHAAPVLDDAGDVVGIMSVLEDVGERRQREGQLRETRRMLERAERLARLGSWTWDVSSDEIVWSDQVYRIFGLDPGTEPPGYHRHPEIIHPEDMAELDRAVDRAIADGTPYELQMRARRPDGEIRHCVVRGRAERTAEGETTRLYGSIQDVTGRVEARRALRMSEAKFRSVVESAPDGIFIQGEGRFVYANPALVDLLGGESEKELLGQEVVSRIHEADREAVIERMRILHEERRPVELREEVMLTLAGESVPVEIAATPLEYEDRPGALVFVRDIGARKRHQAATERLRQAMEQSADAIVIAGRDGRIEHANRAFEELTGYSAADAVGRFLLSLRTDDDEDGPFDDPWEVLESGEVWRGRVTNRREDGETYTCDVSIAPIVDPSGQITGYVEVQRDVTRQLSLEQQLLQSQRLESVGRLAGGLAHDFNNMLTVITGHAELALDRSDVPAAVGEDLAEIRRAAERSATLVGQLLSFARQQVVSPEVLDVNAAMERRIAMLRRLIGEDIDLHWSPGDDPGRVSIDPGQIDQILTNLLVNARDAIEDVGKVTVETARVQFDEAYCAEHVDFVPGRYVMLAVSDSGSGMDKETLPQIFEPFFTTKGDAGGTGLGLSTVYGIVRQNDGFIHVYSELGEGTTFRIYLPRVTDPEGVDGEKDVEACQSEGGSETVLLVEDEPALLKLAERLLAGLGYQVLGASGPREALELARDRAATPDLLMTDVVMPEMNGRDLHREVLKLCPDVKCLYVSGYTADVIVHRGVLDEDVHFLQKPFTVRELAGKVREALTDQGRGPRPSGTSSRDLADSGHSCPES